MIAYNRMFLIGYYCYLVYLVFNIVRNLYYDGVMIVVYQSFETLILLVGLWISMSAYPMDPRPTLRIDRLFNGRFNFHFHSIGTATEYQCCVRLWLQDVSFITWCLYLLYVLLIVD